MWKCSNCDEKFETEAKLEEHREDTERCNDCCAFLENNTISPDGETIYCKNCMGMVG